MLTVQRQTEPTSAKHHDLLKSYVLLPGVKTYPCVCRSMLQQRPSGGSLLNIRSALRTFQFHWSLFVHHGCPPRVRSDWLDQIP